MMKINNRIATAENLKTFNYMEHGSLSHENHAHSMLLITFRILYLKKKIIKFPAL